MGKVIQRAVLSSSRVSWMTHSIGPILVQLSLWSGVGCSGLVDNLCRHLNSGGAVLLMLLNLTTVFDMVDYDFLAHRLADVGVHGVALQWLPSFFLGWGQRVVLRKRGSRSHPLNMQVP